MMGNCMKIGDCKYVHPARDTKTMDLVIELFTPVEDKDNNLENYMNSPVDTTKLHFDAIRYVPDKKSQNNIHKIQHLYMQIKLNEIKTLFPKLDDKEIEYEII
ncbi:hypothetical protein QTN25_007597 [Entamoeba marina]